LTRSLYIPLLLGAQLTTFGQRLEIYGLVFSKGDSLPVSEAKVSLYNEKDSIIESIFSDKKGKFMFQRTKPGVYHITVIKTKYLAKEVPNLKFTGFPNGPLRIPLERNSKENSSSQ